MEQTGERLLISIEDGRQKLGGIGRTTVYELIKQGELEHVNIGRRGFLTATSLAQYVERLTGGAVA